MYALFPTCFVYAVVRHHVFGIRLIFRRGLRYALVSKGFLISEGLLIFGVLYLTAVPLVANLMSGASSSWSWLGTAVVGVGLLTGVPKVNEKVLPAIDRRFFRDAYNARHLLTELGHTVRDYASSPRQLLERVTEQIGMALHPDQVAIFLGPQPWPGLVRGTGADETGVLGRHRGERDFRGTPHGRSPGAAAEPFTDSQSARGAFGDGALEGVDRAGGEFRW